MVAFISRLSLKPFPDSLQKSLNLVPYYKNRNLLVDPSILDLSVMADTAIFAAHKDEFLYPEARISVTFLSGGTINQPKRIPYSLFDFYTSVEATVAALRLSNSVEGRKVCLMHPFAPWAIGNIFLEALLKLGCHAFPLGLGLFPDRSDRELLEFKPEVILGPASLIYKILDQSPLTRYCSVIINAGEPLAPELSERFRSIGIEAFDIYGMAEFDSIASECSQHRLHLLHEFFFFECLTTSDHYGSTSNHLYELIITPLQREAFGVFRYRTGDIIEVETEDCGCGLKGPTMTKVSRLNAIHIQGVTLSEIQLERAISTADIAIDEYQLRIRHEAAGTVTARLFFTAKHHFAQSELEMLHGILNRISLDWEDLVRYRVCNLLLPKQVNSLEDRRTTRGKLLKLLWTKEQME